MMTRSFFNRFARPPLDNDSYARLFIEEHQLPEILYQYLDYVEIERELLDDLMAQALQEVSPPYARQAVAHVLLTLLKTDANHPLIHPKTEPIRELRIALKNLKDGKIPKGYLFPKITNATRLGPGRYTVDPNNTRKHHTNFKPFFTPWEEFMNGVNHLTFILGLAGVGIYQALRRKWGARRPQI